MQDLFNFSKRRNWKEAIVFYLFYAGAFALVSLAFQGHI